MLQQYDVDLLKIITTDNVCEYDSRSGFLLIPFCALEKFIVLRCMLKLLNHNWYIIGIRDTDDYGLYQLENISKLSEHSKYSNNWCYALSQYVEDGVSGISSGTFLQKKIGINSKISLKDVLCDDEMQDKLDLLLYQQQHREYKDKVVVSIDSDGDLCLYEVGSNADK